MSGRRSGFIVYDGLPHARGAAQRLDSPDPRRCWAELVGFLDACTDWTPPSRFQLSLVVSDDLPLGTLEAATAAARARLGEPRRNALPRSRPTRDETWWDVSASSVPAALEWIAEQQLPPQANGMQSATLSFVTRFRLQDPRSGDVLPFQGPEPYAQGGRLLGVVPYGQSRLFAQLAATSTCSLVLCLPFECVDDGARGLVAALQARLPFALEPARWSRWALAPDGSYHAAEMVALP